MQLKPQKPQRRHPHRKHRHTRSRAHPQPRTQVHTPTTTPMCTRPHTQAHTRTRAYTPLCEQPPSHKHLHTHASAPPTCTLHSRPHHVPVHVRAHTTHAHLHPPISHYAHMHTLTAPRTRVLRRAHATRTTPPSRPPCIHVHAHPHTPAHAYTFLRTHTSEWLALLWPSESGLAFLNLSLAPPLPSRGGSAGKDQGVLGRPGAEGRLDGRAWRCRSLTGNPASSSGHASREAFSTLTPNPSPLLVKSSGERLESHLPASPIQAPRVRTAGFQTRGRDRRLWLKQALPADLGWRDDAVSTWAPSRPLPRAPSALGGGARVCGGRAPCRRRTPVPTSQDTGPPRPLSGGRRDAVSVRLLFVCSFHYGTVPTYVKVG